MHELSQPELELEPEILAAMATAMGVAPSTSEVRGF